VVPGPGSGLKLFQTSPGQLIFIEYFTTYFQIFLLYSDSKSVSGEFLYPNSMKAPTDHNSVTKSRILSQT